jgi:hypothetical protein
MYSSGGSGIRNENIGSKPEVACLVTSAPSQVRVLKGISLEASAKAHFMSFILFTKLFNKSFITHSSFFNCVRINYNRSQLMILT